MRKIKWNRVPVAMMVLAALWSADAARNRTVAADDNVVYLDSAGGLVDEVYRKVFWDPFTAATGIRVINDSTTDVAVKLRAMVLSGNVEWDVASIQGGDFLRGIKTDYFEKLDQSMLPVKDMVPGSINEYGIWDGPNATILTWDTNKWPMSGKHPTSLMDLWNQTDFPGPRCVRRDALDTLELGALHAGIPVDKLYPIDETKAYAELDKLKPNVAVWWTTGAQSVQSVINRECVMSMTWNGRPYQLVVREKAPLGIAWGDARMHTAWWAIPKGAKHYANAMKLIAWMQDPVRQAASAKESGYVGGNSKSVDLMAPEVRDFLVTSPSHRADVGLADEAYWEEQGPALRKRFTAWLIGN